MIESGDYVDIRFQDENRYKKPVGIYWLQAAAVKVAQTRRRWPRHLQHRHLSAAVVRRRGRRGAADLLGGARVRVAARGGAGGADAGGVDPARRRGAAGQDRCRAARRPASRPWVRSAAPTSAGGACLACRTCKRRAAAMAAAGDFLDRDGGRRAAQGPADFHVRRACGWRARGGRSFGGVAAPAQARGRRCVDDPAGAAVVRRRSCRAAAGAFSRTHSARDLFAKVGSRPGIPRHAAGILSRCCSG